MAKFLRALGLSNLAASFGALAFALMPKLFAHFGAGHLTLVYALSWLPWLMWSIAAETRRYAWFSSLFWALTFLADVRWGIYAGLLWGVYYLFRNSNSEQRPANLPVIKWMGNLALQGMAALGLVAPLAWPLVEYTRLTSRTSLEAADFSLYSLPVSRLLSFFFPDFGGFHEWVFYGGALIFLLCLASVIVWKPSAEMLFWLIILGVSTLFALGENLPGFDWLSGLPGIGLLRVPSRALFLTQFSMILLASSALHQFQMKMDKRQTKRLFLLMFSLTILILVFWLGILFLVKKIPINFLWGGAILLAGTAWLLFCMKRKENLDAWHRHLVFGIVLLCLLDWGVVDRSLFTLKSVSQAMTAENLAQYFSLQVGQFRIYSPSYSLPQQTAARYGLEFASGVDPLPLQSYTQFMEQASGVPGIGYSVSIPPFASGNPQVDNQDYLPQGELLGLLNVGYILSAFPIETEHLDELFIQDGIYVYRNLLNRPRTWIEREGQLTSQRAEVTWFSPNQIVIQAQGPGRLVLAEVAYPGWRAYLDGEPIAIQTYQGLLRSVDLPDGAHRLQFRFVPATLGVGLVIFMVTAIVLTLYTIRQDKPPRRS